MFFLYSDGEEGFRCRDCGDVLAYEPDPPETSRRSLVVPAGLEGSGLHERLERLAGTDGTRVLVDRAEGERAVRPEPCQVEVRSLISQSVSSEG